jgi:formylglycine-generating enzyme required for sulfatase activity
VHGVACALAALGILVLSAACSTSSDDGADGTSDATPNPNGKLDGAQCALGNDCKSGLCSGGTCMPTPGGSGAGNQTDIGCGGSDSPACANGKKCKVATDCTSGVCSGGTCAAPTCNDGVKNGDETDVDCGGSTCAKCAVDKACAAHADCATDACSYANKCVAFKGCTGHFGGDTCGAGETGDSAAQHESCCTSIAITDKPGAAFALDKYDVTAGRMRAFVERYNGDLQSWAKANPSWNQAWTPNLPASMSDALYLLGPGGKRGCNVVSQGGRTYAQPPIDGNGAEVSDFSQDVLDEKALNCVTWFLAQAVCAFDGGRLASLAEITWAFQNGAKNTQYPWQWRDNTAYSASAADLRLVHVYSYQTPNPPAALRQVGTGAGAYPLDHAFWIAPPGRRPDGANQYGAEDIAGNMLKWINDTPRNFTWTLSWENHPKNLTATIWNPSDGPDGYYAIGARCAR